MHNKKRHFKNRSNNGRSRPSNGHSQLSINKVYDSNGPDTKIRGTAQHIYEKYQSLARDATSAGDRILSENYMQHAEHYLRIINAIQEQMQTYYRENPGSSEESPAYQGGENASSEEYSEENSSHHPIGNTTSPSVISEEKSHEHQNNFLRRPHYTKPIKRTPRPASDFKTEHKVQNTESVSVPNVPSPQPSQITENPPEEVHRRRVVRRRPATAKTSVASETSKDSHEKTSET